jgi:predicted O-methyltransferase YrrM
VKGKCCSLDKQAKDGHHLMLTGREREAIRALWEEKLSQDSRNLPLQERHRNLEPASAEFICALACGCRARKLLEIGGSSGLSTIALAAAAGETDGRLISLEIEPHRQELSRKRLEGLGLAERVDYVLADAGTVLRRFYDLDFVLMDCEKDDYIRFLAMLNLAQGAVVVADNIISHNLSDYVQAVRAYPNVESVTLPIGKGLEVSRFIKGKGSSS